MHTCVQVPSPGLCGCATQLTLLTLRTNAAGRMASSAEAAAALPSLKELPALCGVHFHADQVEWEDDEVDGQAAFVAALCGGRPGLSMWCEGRPELNVGPLDVAPPAIATSLPPFGIEPLRLLFKLFDISPPHP